MDDRTPRVPGNRFKRSGDENDSASFRKRSREYSSSYEYDEQDDHSSTAPVNISGMANQPMSPIGHVQYPSFERPSRRGLVVTVIVGVLLVALILFASSRLLACANIGMTTENGVTVQVHVPEGVSSRTIAEELAERGVVASAAIFMDEVTAQGVDTALKPGTYQLVTGMDLEELIATLVAGEKTQSSGTAKLTLPEGLTVRRTAAAVEKAVGIPSADFIEQAKASNYEEEYPFLHEAHADSLEGYLFPKTYEISLDASADEVIRILLSQYQKEVNGVDLSGVEARGLSQVQLLTIASLIERETSVPDERAVVSSVIYNRLDLDMPLQIDAAIQYALGETKPNLSLDDLKVESEYNVYINKGLPPGPICSPSRASIEAAAHPEQTGYIYYVATGVAGQHSFHEDYESFLKAKDAYKSSQGS